VMNLSADIRASGGDVSLEVSLRIGSGETVALLGPNGSGKTTLLRVMAGLHVLDAGRVTLGRDVWEDTAAGKRLHPRERGVGMMFQDLALFPHMSALDNVAYPLRTRIARSPARRRATKMMQERGIGHLAPRSPARLSGGERQAVALARALIAEPRVLLLDEPLSALDVRNRASARRDLRSILQAFTGTRILVTHDPLEAGALADRILVLEGGRIVQEGTLGDIGTRPRSQFVAAVAGVNLLRGRVVRRAGMTFLETSEGKLAIVAEEIEEGADALATVHPHAIALSRKEPHGSVRNALRVVVAEVDVFGERVRVRLDSRPPLIAEITDAACDELHLRAGEELWASLKATEIDVYPA
jgi:molybdate transport system ATP-binding protein